MNKTKIEWCDYTINPVKGLCPVGCSYCYARAMYKRFHWDTDITPDIYAFEKLPKKPSRIFVGSTIDLFHSKTKEFMYNILMECRDNPQHTFIFLTKCPENLREFSPFPDNCWVGCSATSPEMFHKAVHGLTWIEASKKFISFEPLLEPLGIDSELLSGLLHVAADWVIIGQQTPVRKSTMPSIEWIKEIVEAADNAETPVFLKYNLYNLFELPNIPNGYDVPKWAHANHGINILRQEFPFIQR